MNTSVNYAILAERVQTLRSEADTARRARQARRSRRALAAGGRRRPGTFRAITPKVGEAL